MNELSCLIKNETIIENTSFYVVQESETKKEHLIPKSQLQTFKNIKPFTTYDFLEEFNTKHNKTYLSITHPDFRLGQEKVLTILNILEIEGKTYFETESDFFVPLKVSALKCQKNFSTVKCKVVGYKRGRPILKNIDTSNSKWNIGDVKPFKIKGFGQFYDKNKNTISSIKLDVGNPDEICEIRIQSWQNSKDWKFEEINCKVIGLLQNGLPKLITFDKRHPHYEIGEIYDFIVKGFEEKMSYKGFNYKVIILADDYGNKYEVLALPNQENKIGVGEKIKCEIENINTRLHLKQVNCKDPFFYDFDEIIKEGNFKNQYFLKWLEKKDEYSLKLKLQYEQQSGFWVFTYCNHILTKMKFDESKRGNLPEVLNIIEIHTKFENWILSSGILRAIQDDEERKLNKLKTLQIIENNNLEKSAVNSILKFQLKEFYQKQSLKINFKEIYYLIKHSDFENLNEIEFLNFLLNTKSFDKENKYIIKRLINYIDKSLEIYKNSLKREHFILSQNLRNDQRAEVIKYINWIYIQIYLSNLTNLIEETNILISKFYRFNTLLNHDIEINQKLLLNAFYIISNVNEKYNIPVKVVDDKIKISFDLLEDNPNKGNLIKLDKKFIKTRLTQKHYNGFKAIINETEGFLPFQNITDPQLKKYNQENIEWETNIAVTLYCPKFQYFICKQLEFPSDNFYSKNSKKDQKLTRGDIIYGKIKNVTTFESTNFGVFISTEYGDGLIHQNNLTNAKLDLYDVKNIFKIGDKIPVYVLVHNEDKINFSLKHLIGTKYEAEYYDIFNHYELDEEDLLSDADLNYDFKIEIEKGFIFEQFAFYQTSIEEKIKYIKFAKAFFSNTKNARSYLLNIYIEYFNSIEYLDNLIQDYSIDKYDDFRAFIIQIKEKVHLKTLENFPESKNLLFFIDILYLFNSKNENDLEAIFDLVKKSLHENEILLKAIAKTVLSNNLLITEVDETNKLSLNEYTFKNLKRIREYLNQGVLSVEESVDDKLEKELKEKRNYWLKKINEDEGEKLEFKATFITPVPSNDQKRIIVALEKELKRKTNEIDIQKIKIKIGELKEQNKNVRGIDKIIIHSALKTICAFANTNGGYLLLGVSDDKKIYGLEQDYKSFKDDQNRDGFGKYFDAIIKDYFGESFSSSLLEKEYLKFPKGDILVVKVKKSTEEIFLLKNELGNKEESIYVRNLSSSNKLKGIELSKFIKNKYRQQIISNSN